MTCFSLFSDGLQVSIAEVRAQKGASKTYLTVADWPDLDKEHDERVAKNMTEKLACLNPPIATLHSWTNMESNLVWYNQEASSLILQGWAVPRSSLRL